MIMENATKQQMYSKLCSNLETALLITLALVIFSFSFFFSHSKSIPFLLTIPIALLSTIFLLTLKKKKVSQDENLVQEKLKKDELQSSLDVSTQREINLQSETSEKNDDHEQQVEAQSDYSFPSDSESSNFSIMDKNFELHILQEHKQEGDLKSESSSLPSDSEISDVSNSIIEESFEIDHNNGNHYVASFEFDSLTSDDDEDQEDDDEEEEEDSLIEINLPRNNLSDLFEDPKQKLESKLPDFLPDSIFMQEGLMELLEEMNEMNEDENLIEIDISMGSTNSSDFRLKQDLAYYGDQCVLSD